MIKSICTDESISDWIDGSLKGIEEHVQVRHGHLVARISGKFFVMMGCNLGGFFNFVNFVNFWFQSRTEDHTLPSYVRLKIYLDLWTFQLLSSTGFFTLLLPQNHYNGVSGTLHFKIGYIKS